MAAKRYLPSETKLKEMVDRGMTHQEIADKVSKDEGVRVSRVAVSAALSRAGLTQRVRYDDLIPWRVLLQHQHNYDLYMLRLEARKQRGLRLTKADAGRLAAWEQRLKEARAVVHYEPESKEGFFYVPREHQDKGLIREPRARTRAS